MDARALARELEPLIVRERYEWAEVAHRLYPDAEVEITPLGDGVAISGGDALTLSQITGLGLARPLSPGEQAAVDGFLEAHAPARTEVVIASVADPGVPAFFSSRGFVAEEFEDVFTLDLAGWLPAEDAAAPGVAIRLVADDERDAWADLAAEAYASRMPTPLERRFARVIAGRSSATLLWAWVDARPVATGEVTIADGVAWLAADATLPAYRGRGIQRALQEARLALAREAGCALAVSEAVPGGSSHRNMERAGFAPAYTHLIMARSASRG